MIAPLMRSRRFAPMFWCQFFAALGDNFLKNTLALLVLFELGKEEGGAAVTLAGALFILPFFFLSGLGGELADRFDKAGVAQKIKLAEMGAAAVAAAGMLLHAIPLLFVALFLFGVLSALFGPVKYGILPDQLREDELTGGNALIEAATFLAILLGTIGGSIAAAHLVAPLTPPSYAVAGALLAISLASWVSSLFIRPTGPAAPNLEITRNPLASTLALISTLRVDRRLWTGAMVVSWFWLVGAMALSLLPSLVQIAFNGSEYVISLCLTIFAIGVALGSLVAAKASRAHPNLALVPLGAALMAIFCLDIGWLAATAAPSPELLSPAEFLISTGGWHLLVGLFGLAFAGGMFVVPSFAQVQAWAVPQMRARVVAAVNVVSAGYMTGSGLIFGVAQKLGVGLGTLFLILALGNLVAMLLILRAWGKEGLRDLGMFVFSTLFRVELRGLDNMPPLGTRMVIAPNHVSLIDGPLVHVALPIDAAFAVDTTIANAWWAKPFMALIRAHLLDPTRPLAARALVRAVAEGEPIVIFPEGRITVTGGLMKVYEGAAMIADKADAVIVPVRIDGAERSPFSYLRRTQIRKAWLPKITVTILPPQKLTVDPALKGRARRLAAGVALQDIMAEAAVLSAATDQTLFAALVEASRKRAVKGRVAVEDPLGTKLTYGKLILSAQVLGRQLSRLAEKGEAVGVLLPNSAGVVATFFALQTSGRVPAMLNSQLRRRECDFRLQGRQGHDRSHLARLHREGPSRQAGRGAVGGGAHRLSRGCSRGHRQRRQVARHPRRQAPARGARTGRSGRDPVHFRFGGNAERGRPLASQHPDQRGSGARARGRRRRGQGVQRAARLPFLRPDGRADLASHRGRAGLYVSLAAALPHRAGARLSDQRHDHVRHGHFPRRLCALRPSL